MSESLYKGSMPSPRPRYDPKPPPPNVARVIESSTGRFPTWRVRWEQDGKVFETWHSCVSHSAAEMVADAINEGRDIAWEITKTPPPPSTSPAGPVHAWGAYIIGRDIRDRK